MKNFTLYLAITACLLASKLSAQESFESRAKAIAEKIENITREEKALLKSDLEDVNKELELGIITKQFADEKKLKLAETRSKNIETRIAKAQEELKELVQQKVDGKIEEEDKSFKIVFNKPKHKNKEKNKKYKDSIANLSERRTTSQFVFAAGVNNLVTDKSVANSDYRYWGSRFYEWGFTSNTRIFKNDNLLHLKYGFSVMYNNLRPTDNRVFVVNGNQTNLETSAINLDESRLRNVYLAVPLHLEFDFTKARTKDGKPTFKTHQSVRVGMGGYAGLRLKSKQKLSYELDGNDFDTKEKGDFNVNDFIYGVSTYIGYKETSLYLKYDLNPLFTNNAIKQNNVSLGIRFDFN
jgi:hypothetical protein